MRQGMPYLVVGGVGFYERKEIKDIVSYLRLVRNPHDPMALRRVINVPARGIGARTLDEVAAAAAQRRISLWDALGRWRRRRLLPARATQPLRRFRELIESLRAEAAGMGVKDLISRVLAASGYARGPRPGRHPREPGPPREPGRAPVRGGGVRGPQRRADPHRLPRPGLAPRRHRHGEGGRPRRSDDPAFGEGAGVRRGVPGRARGGAHAPRAQPRERRRHRGGAPPGLRGHDPRPGAAASLAGRRAGRCSASGGPASPAGSWRRSRGTAWR